MDDFIIYRAWPLEKIKEARNTFVETMHNDAGVEELQAGLHCLDFMTRASEVPEEYRYMIDSAIDEANIRIGLMLGKEVEDATQQELYNTLDASLRRLRSTVKNLQKTMREVSDEQVYRFIRKINNS